MSALLALLAAALLHPGASPAQAFPPERPAERLAERLAERPVERPVEPPITALALAPGGGELVVGSQHGLAVHTWPGLGPSRELATQLAHVHDVAFAPDGASLASVGGEPGYAGVLEIHSWPAGELLARRDLADDLLYAVAWHPDGDRVVCAGHRGEVLVVDVGEDGEPRRLEGHLSPVLAAAFTPDGSVLVTGGADRSLRVWDVEAGTCLHVLSNHTGAVRAVAARPPGLAGPPLVASIGDDRTLRLWQPTIGRLVRFARLPAEPLALAWSADASQLLVTARDGLLYAVDPASVSVTASVRALDRWAYSLAAPRATGEPLAVGGDRAALRAVPQPVPPGPEAATAQPEPRVDESRRETP